MKKITEKIMKFITLFVMMFSSLESPLYVLADATNGGSNYGKGDIILGNTVSKESVTVTKGSLDKAGDIRVKKTVSKVNDEGKYKVSFEIEGKDIITEDEKVKESYTVFVLDSSSSMSDTRAGSGETAWTRAKSAAITFSSALVNAGKTNKISLVTFDSQVRKTKSFANTAFTNSDMGDTHIWTNYEAGLTGAYGLLNGLSADVKKNASLNIIFISDGEPNQGNYTNVLSNLKKLGVNIYTFAYNLSSTSSAYSLLRGISTDNTVTSVTSDNINDILATFVDKVKVEKPAGTNGTLNDGIGTNFKLSGSSQYGGSYESETYPKIEEGKPIKFEFDIQIDVDSPTGLYNTNAGFELTYTKPDGTPGKITCDENPQVYWVQNVYPYTVNYYKDSIDDSNLLKSESRTAAKGTVITENNVEKDKYLDLAGVGYEFNSIDPTSTTISGNGTEVINVLYKLKEFTYTVKYYYDDKLDTTLTDIPAVTYGTEVNPSTYYLAIDKIKEGYVFDTKSDSETITITDNNQVINIYYKRDNFNYTIDYYFDGTLDSSLNVYNTAEFEMVINASDNYLSDSVLNSKHEGFFLNPVTPQDKDSIKIGTDSSKNHINIYYISKSVEDEEIEKSTSTKIVDSENDVVDYSVNYKATIKNAEKDDTVVVTLVDTLPYEIDENKSTLNGGRYDSAKKTITWTITKTVTEFTEEYDVNETINFSVVYKDFANISSTKNNTLVNTVSGNVTVGNITSEGVDDTATVPVEIYGSVVATYKTTDGATLANDESSRGLAGTDYTTDAKDFLGYELVAMPENKDGKYIGDETITVNYVYDKCIGNATDELVKVGPEEVESINSAFDYTIKYDTEITSYVGEVHIKLIDTPEFEIDTKKSIIENNCKFSDGKIICEYDKTIASENDQKISVSTSMTLYYIGINKEEVINTVDSELTYGNEMATNSTDVTTIIPTSRLIIKYLTDNGEVLHDDDVTTSLVGTEYETNMMPFDKYFLKEVKGEEKGFYVSEDTTVTYIYSLIPLPPKTGHETNIYNYIYLLISMLFLFGLKKFN